MSTEEMLVNGSNVVNAGNGQLVSATGIGVVPDHSLHFSHVSQIPHSYGISGLQTDLSYGAFPMHQEGQLAPNTYPLPDPAILTQQRKTERRRPPGKKDLSIPHIPRPRNAFILFRSAFIEQKNGKELASKQQNLSRIAAMVWKSMNSAEQDPWYKLAAEEKQAHYAANPGYTFQPTGRTEANKKKTRKPAMEPAVEENSCKQIADLIINGVQGVDLVAAAKSIGVAPWPKLEGGAGGGRRRRTDPSEAMFEYIDDEGSSEGDPKQYPPTSPSQYQHGTQTGYEY